MVKDPSQSLEIYCDECGKQITQRNDYVAGDLFSIHLGKYHSQCFEARQYHEVKGERRYYRLAPSPLSKGFGWLLAISSPLLAIGLGFLLSNAAYHKFRPPPYQMPALLKILYETQCEQNIQSACEALKPPPPLDPLTQQETTWIALAAFAGILLGAWPGIAYLITHIRWGQKLPESPIK